MSKFFFFVSNVSFFFQPRARQARAFNSALRQPLVHYRRLLRAVVWQREADGTAERDQVRRCYRGHRLQRVRACAGKGPGSPRRGILGILLLGL